MLTHDTHIRVCYGDTDKMGVVYYGTYPRYYEIARTEMLRSFGISYREMEENGLVLPVRNLHITYLKPAFYDDLLTVRTILEELPTVRFRLKTEIYNPVMKLINQGEVTLIFTNPETGKAMKPPQWVLEKFRKLME